MSVKIKNRHRLKNKDIKEVINSLQKKYNDVFFNTDSTVETGDINDIRILIVDNSIDFIFLKNELVMTLRGLLKYKPKKYFVVVDMGAVSFVVKGADIMTPGIVDADEEIKKNDYVWICDENHKKPLSVGIALISGKEMLSKSGGKAIKNIHYIGDKLWNLTEL